MKTQKSNQDAKIFISNNIALTNETQWKNRVKTFDVYSICDDKSIFIGMLELTESLSKERIYAALKSQQDYFLLGYTDDPKLAQSQITDINIFGVDALNKLKRIVKRIISGTNIKPLYTYRDIAIYQNQYQCEYEIYTKNIDDVVVSIEKQDNLYKIHNDENDDQFLFVHNRNPFTDSEIMKRIYKFTKHIEKVILKELKEYEN